MLTPTKIPSNVPQLITFTALFILGTKVNPPKKYGINTKKSKKVIFNKMV